MKGTVHKTDNGWEIRYMKDFDSKILPYIGKVSIPLLNQSIMDLKEGNEVEFEIEDFWETGLEQSYKIAKIIIPSKKETLEEAAERIYREYPNNPLDKPEWHYNRDINCFKKRKAFILGAKWQQEQDKNKYSEEDMSEAHFQGWVCQQLNKN